MQTQTCEAQHFPVRAFWVRDGELFRVIRRRISNGSVVLHTDRPMRCGRDFGLFLPNSKIDFVPSEEGEDAKLDS